MGIEKSTTGVPMKIDEIGARKFVLELLKNRKTSSAPYIAEAIERKFGIKIHPHSVRKFIKKTKVAQQTLETMDTKEIKEYEKLALDYKQELLDTLAEIKEVKQYAKTQKDLASYSNLVGRVFQAIELFAKIKGDLAQVGQIDINVLYDAVAKRVSEENKETRKMLTGKDLDIKTIINEEEKEFTAQLTSNEGKDILEINMKKGD